jgi:hypothetical protein
VGREQPKAMFSLKVPQNSAIPVRFVSTQRSRHVVVPRGLKVVRPSQFCGESQADGRANREDAGKKNDTDHQVVGRVNRS